MAATHEILNQPPPLVDWNLYAADAALRTGVERYGAAWADGELVAFGARVGSAEVLAWGELANRQLPLLRSHDRYGNRVDEVDYHPAYHSLMALSVEHGLIALPWEVPRPGAHVARAALVHLVAQVEQGHCCPLAIGYSAFPSLRHQPEVAAEWEPRLVSRRYDSRFIPATEKTWALVGMAMTEKQGGSDVRANTTRAEPIGRGGPGGEYLLTGHKWFCSVPMSDAFLVLAQAPRGLSCFLLPRWTPDGRRNRFFLQRLKDKLGNRSNASSEVELDAAWAVLVGEEGRGVAAIIDMVSHTRLDCVINSGAIMRMAVAQAVHHARHRSAFGRRLVDQPLMRNVLADLVLESEAALALMLRVAASFDATPGEGSAAFRRIATAVAKYWVCKRAPVVAGEALECLGGNGYVEESGMPRLYREAPLLSIWEGSGNVICLDVLRALSREPGAREAFLTTLREAAGVDPRLDAAIAEIDRRLGDFTDIEVEARRLVERMAVALQGALLAETAPEPVFAAFAASRLGRDHGGAFGTLPAGTDFTTIIDRAPLPPV